MTKTNKFSKCHTLKGTSFADANNSIVLKQNSCVEEN